ncbi:autophagy-related protein 16-1-like [Rhopilema esculentum]|uniref:autophagy-related protein 16-1-like n=1 Tax=Rhopilema esculentum TaxID=499914 RepID=UPI0031D51BB0
MAEEVDWKGRIILALTERNKLQQYFFKDIVLSQNRLSENASVIKSKLSEQEHQIFQLKQETLELQGKLALGSGAGIAGAVANEKIMSLEQKIYRLQEELTEQHRNRGEHANQIIELTNQVKLKDEQLSFKEAQLLDSQNNLEAMSIESKRIQASMAELEETSQCLKDEYQALQLLYNSIEVKLRKTQEENQQLVERWMKEKAIDADKINSENEQQAKLRQEKMQRELNDAAKESVGFIQRLTKTLSHDIPLDTVDIGITPPPFAYVTSIPDNPRVSLDAHDGEVLSTQFSPSGKYVATGGSDRRVKIWETGRGHLSESSVLHGCNASILCVRFDIQEKLILATSNDKACRIWTISDQRIRHTLTGHSEKVLAARFLGADSSKIVSGSHDRTLKIWDLRSKVCTKTIFAMSSCNDLIASDLTGTSIISGHFDKKIRFWDIRSDSNTNEIQLPGKVTSLDLAPDMNSLLVCTRDDSLKLIDLRRNQVVSTYRAEGFKVAFDWTRACFSPDVQFVMCGSYDGGVYVWNARTDKLEKTLREHKSSVVACAWHPNGSSLVTCDRNKHLIMWTDI